MESGFSRIRCQGAAKHRDDKGLMNSVARPQIRCEQHHATLSVSDVQASAEFYATKLGFVRMSDYARERLGISGSEADVTQRVVKRLDQLPLLREASPQDGGSDCHTPHAGALAPSAATAAGVRLGTACSVDRGRGARRGRRSGTGSRKKTRRGSPWAAGRGGWAATRHRFP